MGSRWDEYFSQKTRYACTDRDIEFNIYISLPSHAIHGDSTPILLCLHGAGYSGLTFAPLTRAISEKIPHCCVVAPDLRGHGDTVAGDELDLSANTLVEDVTSLYRYCRADHAMSGPLILIGWSMGAAIAVKCARTMDHVSGLVAIDVVEGTALGSLRTMSSILHQRPKGFKSIPDAVEWALSTGTTRRQKSAEVSIPGMLKCVHGSVETDEAGCDSLQPLGRIQEDQESDSSAPSGSNDMYTWRVDLSRSERYWEGWFRGLSQAFLDVPCPKVLMLAGTDRLDKTLMIAQMQGKFQLSVVPKSGHAVHEDQPEMVADTIGNFMKRYDIV